MNSRAAGLRNGSRANRTLDSSRLDGARDRTTRSRTADSSDRYVSLRVVDGSLREGRHRDGGYRSYDGRDTVWVRDRPHEIRHTHRNEHVYYDHHGYSHHQIVWPSYRYIVSYNYGWSPYYWSHWSYCDPWWSYRVIYPYYHRKFIFVSLGGYWPIHYSYRRYFWYGCHPYNWYGYYPVPYEVAGDTYNYYTYNYYGSADGGYSTAEPANTIQPADHNTFADVREKLAREAAQQPAPATSADTYFEQAVQAFEANDFDAAAADFAYAAEMAPEDTVLPFAYSQALFALGRYNESAAVLRQALARVEPEKEGVFYPRGLYSDDKILFEQIDLLEAAASANPLDADLQLLLGYHLLGIGETDAAIGPLQTASINLDNAGSATVLLNLIARIKEGEASGPEQPSAMKEETDA